MVLLILQKNGVGFAEFRVTRRSFAVLPWKQAEPKICLFCWKQMRRITFSTKFYNTLVDDSWIIEQLYKLQAATTNYWHRNIAKTVASALCHLVWEMGS